MANQHTKRKDDERAFLDTALKRWKLGIEAERDIREEALVDFKFRAGEIWDKDVKALREKDKRPCLTVNKLPQFVRQVTNDQRQNRPAITVSPVDDQGDPELAEIFQGIIRHIEYSSSADVAYDTGFEHAATGGFGYWRVLTEFSDPLSFEQDIRIRRIANPFTVVFDPSATEADGSDARWAFIYEDMLKEDFEAQFPEANLSTGKLDSYNLVGDRAADWMAEGSVRVAEYYYVENVPKTIVLGTDGSVWDKSELEQVFPDGIPEGFIKAERRTEIPAVKWAKITAGEVLERTDWAGRWIPIIPIYGSEILLDGKRVLEGVIRHARDPMRMYCYWASAETEAIALAPKAPWLMPAGADAGFENEWKQANTRNLSVLHYNPTIDGQVLPPPSRSFAEPAGIQAITNARAMSSDDLKATTGIYDASLGARSNEQTGKAILARQNQAQIANFHLIDNLSRAIKHTGRILLDLIPKIFDTERVVRVIGPDQSERVVRLYEPFRDPKDGKLKRFDLNVGRFDVTVDVGPSYQTKRQEAAASMQALVQAAPQVLQVIGDLLIGSMDWPRSKEIAERLKKLLPPQLQDQEGEENPIPPQVQAQMEQMGMQMEQMGAALQQAQARVMQAEQAVQASEAALKNKEGELALKAQESEVKAALEAQKLALEEQKLALEAQKLDLERQQAYLEEMRIMAETVKAVYQQPASVPEGGEAVEAPDATQAPGITREDLAMMFQGLLQGMVANQPMPQPMPPQVIRLTNTHDGIVGVVSEAPNEGVV